MKRGIAAAQREELEREIADWEAERVEEEARESRRFCPHRSGRRSGMTFRRDLR